MSRNQYQFITGLFLLLAGGTLPVAFMSLSSYLVGLVVNLLISVSLAVLIY